MAAVLSTISACPMAELSELQSQIKSGHIRLPAQIRFISFSDKFSRLTAPNLIFRLVFIM